MASGLSHFIVFHLIVLYQILAGEAIDPTQGFTAVPLSKSNLHIQQPYDVPQSDRYSFINGVHKMWVYKTDKPQFEGSPTAPRTEIRISGVWQFEGYGNVPRGTNGMCIMQILGSAPPHATTLQLRVYGGSLTYYRSPVLVSNMYNTWYRVNVIHDTNANNAKGYINGDRKYDRAVRSGGNHFFKVGVYMQNDPLNYMESRCRNINQFLLNGNTTSRMRSTVSQIQA